MLEWGERPAWMDNHRVNAPACTQLGSFCAVGAGAVLSYFNCYMQGNFLEAWHSGHIRKVTVWVSYMRMFVTEQGPCAEVGEAAARRASWSGVVCGGRAHADGRSGVCPPPEVSGICLRENLSKELWLRLRWNDEHALMSPAALSWRGLQTLLRYSHRRSTVHSLQFRSSCPRTLDLSITSLLSIHTDFMLCSINIFNVCSCQWDAL